MTQGGKPRKLFKVAQEFNVSTQTIVETLDDKGYSIESRPNATITPEMYSALEEAYGVDKAKSREHERAREEYEEHRNTLRQNRNESVTLDNLLEPLDDLPLEPMDEKAEEEKQETSESQPEKTPEKVEEKKEGEKAEETRPAEPQKEKKVEEKPVTADKSSEKVEEKEDKQEESKPSEPAVKKEKTEKETEKNIEEPVQAKIEDNKPEKEEVVQEPEDEEELDEEFETDEDVIRAQTEKLRGTRVLGTINIPKETPKKKKSKSDGPESGEDEEKQARRKKKKRLKRSKKKNKDTNTEEAKKDETANGSTTSKKKKKSKRGKRVDEEDVEQKMKETMALLQSSGGAGKKRQKRRRQKRDEMAAERESEALEREQQDAVLELTEFITVSDLAEILNVNPTDIITICMNLGIMVSINQRLDASTIELITEEYGREVRFVDADEMLEDIVEEEDDEKDLEPRAPVVTVMGHVDHGKTSLLDYVRKTHVAAREAGGITQHIGAYEVILPGDRKITFLDTPGHEAFTAMRARGAQVTDIVILVVAADDSVMPQTIEAINHAQAAGVSIIVGINKIDKPGASPDKIRQQLSDHNVLVEEWGGKYQSALVSAKTGEGIDELLEKVLIEAELLELKANPDRNASGIVLESRVDKGKGVVANLLVEKGTLHIGDPFVAGQYYGRVRAMENEFGNRIESAGPSTPVQLTGFDGIPQAGDKLIAMDDEKRAKDIAQQRQQIKREQDLRKIKHITLDDLSRRMALGEVAELNIIIKGDVDGSIEALSGALQKLSTDEVKVNIIHTGVGAITESDVLLASASDGIIIGFQVRPSTNARKLAEREEIDIRLFSVIYDAVDAVHDALEGLLSPEINEKITATIEVRDTFKVPGVGVVAGCYVTDGKITRNNKIRLIRDGIVIYDGELESLKRFKDDVREVMSGYECGLSIKNYNDIKVGDVIEGYEVVETKRKLA